MRFFKQSKLILGRLFLASLFVGTIWMSASGCIDEDHGRDHDHVVVEHDHDHDHDHDHPDWH